MLITYSVHLYLLPNFLTNIFTFVYLFVRCCMLTCLAVASSVTTLVLTTGHIVTLASYATATLAPYAAYQTHKLQKLGGIRGEQNTLRQSTNELTEQNNILSESIDKLEVQVTA